MAKTWQNIPKPGITYMWYLLYICSVSLLVMPNSILNLD